MAKKSKTEQPGTEVTNWEEELAREARAIAKTETPSVNKIKFTSGIMSYMDSAMADNTLDCIVVAVIAEQVWYPDKWKANDVKPPGCFAFGMPGDPLRPHVKVPEPVNEDCDSCPKYKWGSDPEGGRGKACSTRRRLAVIPAPDSLKDISESDLAMMSIPVTSVKTWANYVNKLSTATQRPPWGVLTRVMLVPDAKNQFKVTFSYLKELSSEQLPLVHPRIDAALNSLLIPYEMTPENTSEEEGDKKY